MIRLLGLALVVALLRHLILWDVVLTAPGVLAAKVERRPVVVAYSRESALRSIEKAEFQPVDLRRTQALPIVGGQLAWQLPMPQSMAILERFRQRATAKHLMFLVSPDDRDAGLKVARAVCETLGVRDAGFVVWGNRP